MGRKFAAFSRYRPRWLTLVVLLVVATPVALANLTFDEGLAAGGSILHRSYGWPLIWHRYLAAGWGWEFLTVGWYYSAARLAGNLVMWTGMLVVPAGICEWLLRRFRPRPRWSLRTMLVVVGLAAAPCAWFAAARHQAKFDDEIIAALPPGGPGACGAVLRRRGPKWLDLLGVDRYRREIVLAEPGRAFHGGNIDDEKLLFRLAQLPKLEELHLVVDQFTPAMTDALNRMQALRALKVAHAWHEHTGYGRVSRVPLPPIGGMRELTELELNGIAFGDETLAGLTKLKHLTLDGEFGVYAGNRNRAVWHECLAAIGTMPQIERLDLYDMTVNNEGLACLAGLANLKTLSLHYVRTNGPPLFKHLPALPRLETVDIDGADINDRDLAQLAVQPHLKSLSVRNTRATAAGLAALASLECLEELTLDGDETSPADSCISAAGLRSLRAIKRLKKLHLGRYSLSENDLAGFRLAVEALRKANPGILIDGDRVAIGFLGPDFGPSFSDDMFRYRKPTCLPESGVPWMTPSQRAEFEAEGGWARFHGAGCKGKTASF